MYTLKCDSFCERSWCSRDCVAAAAAAAAAVAAADTPPPLLLIAAVADEFAALLGDGWPECAGLSLSRAGNGDAGGCCCVPEAELFTREECEGGVPASVCGPEVNNEAAGGRAGELDDDDAEEVLTGET